MRIGVMIGPERGDSARKVTRMVADIDGRAGFCPNMPKKAIAPKNRYKATAETIGEVASGKFMALIIIAT